MRRRIQHVHFVGIGGIGMCGLAELLHNQGYRVGGSDLRDGPSIERLRGLGVDVAIGHAAERLGDADVVVYSSAVRGDNPELLEAEHRKIPVIPRAEMLAEVMRLKEGIAVAGSHGKTTTTSLVAHVLGAAGLDPTAVIGGRVLASDASPTTTRLGAGELLVAEADESDGSFLRLAPVIGVITNIDSEHLDHYGSYAALEEAFVAFANRVPFWGLAVLCLDHPGVQAILPKMTRRTVTYGFASQADLVASDVRSEGHGTRFAVRRRDTPLGEVGLPLPGRHNVQNALATLAIALELEVPFPVAAEALASFVGIERRFERKGSARGVALVDDYGHHPAEIRATLAAAREIHDGRIVVAFQPHRYTRTRDLWDDFTAAFNDADVLLVTEIYAAGEPKLPGIETANLVEAIEAHGHRDVHFVRDLEELPERVARIARPGDLVMTLGAGSISATGQRILAALESAE
ncbi:MAG: UDP-N-acetylmuramate--L-alanine ligase [Deltaproteobacteria bacterium]|nr:UDP-N-acetylmuramate--L-alanine ligase [Deltaproteobacteria bacterium]MBW2360143.1 UDP-N-acetylmuramate--L-alanine ligase [Deltaproteobacteria bacterium]